MTALLLLLAQDLTASGAFKKVGRVWTAGKNIDAQEMRDNWVERKFQAARGVQLHAWARVGGCCRETLQAFYQVSGGTTEHKGKPFSVDPGENLAAMLNLPPDGMPKAHQGHGEKRPDLWIWVSIPLPAYADEGTKTIRLMTDQKGFSVARIHVGRDPEPPRD